MLWTKLRGVAVDPTRVPLVWSGSLAAGLALSLVACEPPAGPPGSGATTTEQPSDAGTTTHDAGTTPNDASTTPTGTTPTGATTTTDAGGELGPWAPTAGYPLAANSCVGTSPNLYCAEQTCVTNSQYVYCVGGASTSTYYSQLSSTGPGAWTRAADYPEAIQDESCVVSANYIYCVGGRVDGADGGFINLADVYYAPLLSPGIGTWTASTPFPTAVLDAQCMTYSGTIYCVSGTDTYYAPLSSTGVGAWAPTSPPPTPTEGCSAVGGYAYCYGGGSCDPVGDPSDCYSFSYFAPLTASGIGTWTSTTQLPTSVSATYATAGSYIYYLSVPVFFASVSADGIGPWQTTTNYPDSPYQLYPSNCFSSDGYLYCANPVANGSYFAPIGVPDPQALQLENPPPFPRSDYLVPACIKGGGVSVNGVGAPNFEVNIDDAIVFDCASQAATDAGCTTIATTSSSSGDPVPDGSLFLEGGAPNVPCDYELTIWYPCTTPTPADTNCCLLPAVGYTTPFNEWCISVGSDSFIIASKLNLQPAGQVYTGGLPP
jgi:hypothetical protein